MSPSILSTPIQLGKHTCLNRVALAPLTRGRHEETHGVVSALHGVYYSQRGGKKGAGLVISEATGISRQGLGWYRAPGIWSEDQTAGWTKVIKAVHDTGSLFAVQIWHMGRQASADVTGQPTVAPSPIALEGDVTGVRGEKAPYTTPRALTEEDIKQIVADYGTATKNALAAGADFVEIHAANGYLVDQFLQSVSNERTDAYGGSIENRLRFLREVVTSSIAAAGGDSQAVGIRLSPNGNFGGMGSADNNETFDAAIRWLGEQKLAYIHLCDGLGFGFHELSEPYTLARGRAILKDVDASTTRLIGAVGYTKETAVERLEEGNADLIAFGRPFMSNPDLTYRFEKDLPLADTADYAHWWGWQLNEEGFTTYQAAQEA